METSVGEITGDNRPEPRKPKRRRPPEKDKVGAGENAEEVNDGDHGEKHADNQQISALLRSRHLAQTPTIVDENEK